MENGNCYNEIDSRNHFFYNKRDKKRIRGTKNVPTILSGEDQIAFAVKDSKESVTGSYTSYAKTVSYFKIHRDDGTCRQKKSFAKSRYDRTGSEK